MKEELKLRLEKLSQRIAKYGVSSNLVIDSLLKGELKGEKGSLAVCLDSAEAFMTQMEEFAHEGGERTIKDALPVLFDISLQSQDFCKDLSMIELLKALVQDRCLSTLRT